MSPVEVRPRLLGIGIACLDYLFLAPRCAPGEQAPLRDYCLAGGGLVGTALVAAARLGARTAIRGWVGDDRAGRRVTEGLQAEGVDTSAVAVTAGGRTPVSFIHVEPATGERTIYHSGDLRGVPPQRQQSMGELPLDCEVLLLDAVWPEASLAAAAAARREGIASVADFTPTPELRRLASLTAALIVPRTGAERLAPGASYPEKLKAIAATGAGFAAVTAGDGGCYYLEGDAVRHQAAFRVEVVDTTGAGDVFHGAFAYALGCGWSHAKAVEFASAVAALSCRALGGRQAIPRLEEALEFLSRHGSDGWRR